MAIRIPIVTEFNSKGIKQAVKQFKQLETAGEKAQFALKKAAIPAAAAFTAVAAGLFDATKAAMQDQAAQKALARQIQRSTKATDAQIEANEEWISQQGQLLGVTDDELRPALAGLVRVTKSIPAAQKAASLAMNIAAAKGVSLESVTKSLEKAYGGNLGALKKIAPELKGLIDSGATAEEVFEALNKKFGGEAAAAAETAEGKFKRLKIAFDETKESIGAGLLPIVESALPFLQSFAKWAQDNPKTFTEIAAAIGLITGAMILLNAAMAANPIVLAVGAAAVSAFAVYKFGPQVASDLKKTATNVASKFDAKSSSVYQAGNLTPYDSQRTLAPATMGNRGVMIQVNTGVGDPVKIGKEVNNVLNAYLRRSK
jgi:ElaB/YqjD/DUF883 family membrane-anchored ribosome-binding protein